MSHTDVPNVNNVQALFGLLGFILTDEVAARLRKGA
jgi:hypothetical protein